MKRLLKNLLFIGVGFISLNSFAQEKSLLEEYNSFSLKQNPPTVITGSMQEGLSLLEQGKKDIYYSLEISKNEKPVYKTNFSIKNSTLFNIFSGNIQKKSMQLEEKNVGNQGRIIGGQKANSKEEFEKIEIKMMVYVDRNNENLWSQFFLKEQLKENKEIGAIVGLNNEAQGVNIEKNPKEALSAKEIVVIHQDKEQTSFTWDDYIFTLKAKLK